MYIALQDNFEKRKQEIEEYFAQLRNIMDQREHELIDNLNMVTIPIIIFMILYFSILIKLKTKIKKNKI